MDVRTPLGLFVGTVVAGLPLAVGIGMAYASSVNDGFIPLPTKSPSAVQDFGNPRTIPTPVKLKPTSNEQGRVESETYIPEVVKQAPEGDTNSARAEEPTHEPSTPSTEPTQPQDPPSTGQTASPPPAGGGGHEAPPPAHPAGESGPIATNDQPAPKDS
jgi:hypothetical protein